MPAPPTLTAHTATGRSLLQDATHDTRRCTHPPPPSRRTVLQAGSLVLLLGARTSRGATILAVRVWPAPDYSRVTIESDGQLTTKQIFRGQPARGWRWTSKASTSTRRCASWWPRSRPTTPTSAGIRAGQNAPGVVRLVLDLKQPCCRRCSPCPPVAAYQHRLVLDLYPAQAADPLEALIAERLKRQRPRRTAPPLPRTRAGATTANGRRARPAGRADGQAGRAPPRAACRPRPRRPATASSGAPPQPRLQPRPRRLRPPPTGSSSWRWTPATAAKTPAPSAPAARAKKTWCCRSPTAARPHQRHHDQRQPHARLPHARRRLFRAAACAGAKGAARAGRPVRQHPCRRVLHAPPARRQRVRAERARRVQLGRALAGRQGKRRPTPWAA
jgi:hypothetical protein